MTVPEWDDMPSDMQTRIATGFITLFCVGFVFGVVGTLTVKALI